MFTEGEEEDKECTLLMAFVTSIASDKRVSRKWWKFLSLMLLFLYRAPLRLITFKQAVSILLPATIIHA